MTLNVGCRLLAGVPRARPLCPNVECVDRLAGGHEETISFQSAEREIAADLRSRIRPSNLPAGLHTVAPL